jgi:hypothetical protein
MTDYTIFMVYLNIKTALYLKGGLGFVYLINLTIWSPQ